MKRVSTERRAGRRSGPSSTAIALAAVGIALLVVFAGATAIVLNPSHLIGTDPGGAATPTVVVAFGQGNSTATPAATPAPTDACARSLGSGKFTRFGDLALSQPGAVGMASYLVPAGNPPQPISLPANAIAWYAPVNPDLSVGYALVICNTSATTAHTIQRVSARLASFRPFSGTANTFHLCGTSVFSPPDQLTHGDCGGAQPTNLFTLSFAAATPGTPGTLTPDSAALPIALPPGVAVSVGIVPVGLTAPGYYAFALNLTLDTQPTGDLTGSTYLQTSSSATVQWNGANCEQPAMRQQIPATPTTPPTYYICP